MRCAGHHQHSGSQDTATDAWEAQGNPETRNTTVCVSTATTDRPQSSGRGSHTEPPHPPLSARQPQQSSHTPQHTAPERGEKRQEMKTND